LVLDLDETLIHSSGAGLENATHFLEYEGGFIYKRPDVDLFLATIRSMFDLFVFTASERPYADAILDIMCPWIDPPHRLYRPSVEEVGGKFRKDLTLFNRGLNKVMLIDDSRDVHSFFPENVLLVKPWRGDPDDRELMAFVMPILEVCEKATDVRSIIRKLAQR
jgi:import inner membrane translocase subunit TIM50